MIVGIHQPNYLPSISYFTKILKSEAFIFLDNVQYAKRNWTNRNRIKSAQGETMITVPVLTKGKYYQKVRDVRISNEKEWAKKHLSNIHNNYKKAYYFIQYFSIFEEIYSRQWEWLAELNIYIIRKICSIIGIDSTFHLASELGGTESTSTDRLVNLTLQVNGDTYLSGIGGKKYLQNEKFRAKNINLVFNTFKPIRYKQEFNNFLENLSIVDLMFNEGPNCLYILKECSKEVE